MEKALISLSNSKITQLERTGDNNLKPDSRKRVLASIRRYISDRGYINISMLSNELGLSRPTVRTLANEVLDEVREEEEPQILAQILWCQELVAELSRDPEAFMKDPIKFLKFQVQSVMLDKITLLQRALRKSRG